MIRILKRLSKALPASLQKIIIKYYLRIKFFGFKYRCPLCRGFFNRFFSAGFDYQVLYNRGVIAAGLRENVRCPRCNSSNRERLIYLYLKYETDFLKVPKDILHIAPEKNLKKKFQDISNDRYRSVDISSPLAQYKMDITSLDFPDSQFDLAVCSHVLEHISDDARAMKEINRVLRSGGLGIILVPIAKMQNNTYEDFSINDENGRIRCFGQKDHVRIYAMDIVDRLESAGFIVEICRYASTMANKLSKKYSLDRDEILFLCRKK